jgi:hypothetical protein
LVFGEIGARSLLGRPGVSTVGAELQSSNWAASTFRCRAATRSQARARKFEVTGDPSMSIRGRGPRRDFRVNAILWIR